MITVPFTDKTRESIIADYIFRGYVLLEEQKYGEGNFLIFDTKPRPLSQEERLASLENRVKVLEGKIG